jgi:hypothetical protein
MKFTLLVLTLAVMYTVASSPYHEDGKIKFSMDAHKDSPIGLFFSGSIDPRMETNNKIQAFLKLAGQYIPILEALQGLGNGLEYEYTWRISFAGISLDIYGYLQLYVGWRVTPGGSTTTSYDVTYTPFAYGVTRGRFNGTTWPAMGTVDTTILYVDVSAPIGVTLFTSRKICFGGKYIANPINLQTNLYAALLGCEDEIIDKIINQQPINLRCNYTNPVNFTLLSKNFTNTYSGDLIPQTCFSF